MTPGTPARAQEDMDEAQIDGQQVEVEIPVAVPAPSFANFGVSKEVVDALAMRKIDGTFEIVLGRFGPIKLDKPMSLKATLQLDSCINGKIPDGDLRMKFEMKGTSTADGPNGAKVTIDTDMTAQNSMIKKTAK